MLEKMGEFFDRRLKGYNRHQLSCINFAHDFLQYTAALLPREPGCGARLGWSWNSIFHTTFPPGSPTSTWLRVCSRGCGKNSPTETSS